MEINIEALTIAQVRHIQQLLPQPAPTVPATGPKAHPYKIGANYFIRTVTFHYTGRLTGVTDTELVLEDVSWIADNGRFADALKSGIFKEVEPFPDGSVILGRGAVIDAFVIEHKLPREQK